MMGRTLIAALLLAAPSAGDAGAATQQIGPPTVVSLEDAKRRASEHNPEYRSARNQLSLEGPAGRAAWGGFLPNMAVSAGTGQGFNRRSVAEDVFGNPVPNPDVRTSYTSSSSQGFSLSLDVFDGGAQFQQVGRARAEAISLRSAAALELRRIEAEVERQFFLAQRQGEVLEIELQDQEGRSRDLEATRRLYSLAARGRTDVLGAELDVQRQELSVREAESARGKALLSLTTRIGDPSLEVAGVATADLGLFDPAGLDVVALVERAARESPAVLRAQAQVSVNHADAKIARAGRWPTVSLSGRLSRDAFGPDQSALFDPSPGDQSGGSVSLNVSVPLFQRFSTSYRVAQADVQHRNSEESLRQERLRMAEDVRSRLIDLEDAYRRVEISARARDVAEERLRLVREEYRLAVRTFEDLRSAVRDASQARRDVVGARYDFVAARISLEEAVGGPVAGMTG